MIHMTFDVTLDKHKNIFSGEIVHDIDRQVAIEIDFFICRCIGIVDADVDRVGIYNNEVYVQLDGLSDIGEKCEALTKNYYILLDRYNYILDREYNNMINAIDDLYLI